MSIIITIYHGSDKIVEKPTFGEGKKNNDFIKLFIASSVSMNKEIKILIRRVRIHCIALLKFLVAQWRI